MNNNESTLTSELIASLPYSITNIYKKSARKKAIVRAITDLWEMYNNTQSSDETKNLFNSYTHRKGYDESGGLAYSALNDILAANLMAGNITDQDGKNIRMALINRNDLAGVFRADLYKPTSDLTVSPLQELVYVGGIFPGLCQFLKLQRDDILISPDLPQWDRECFVSSMLVQQALERFYRGPAIDINAHFAENLKTGDRAGFQRDSYFISKRIASMAAWKMHPIMLKFDRALLEVLSDSSSSQPIPGDYLRRLPFGTFYAETPGLTIDSTPVGYIGISFDSVIEESSMQSVLSISIIPFSEKGNWLDSLSLSFNLSSGSIDEQIQRRKENRIKNLAREAEYYSKYSDEELQDAHSETVDHSETLLKIGVQIALYVSSGQPDYDYEKATVLYKASRSKKPVGNTKQLVEYDVGQKVASALKLYAEKYGGPYEGGGEGSGRTVSPHWRKAHWNTYWVGKGREERLVRWLAPTPINVELGDHLPVTERDVIDNRPETACALVGR